jgi:hypothetical protein
MRPQQIALTCALLALRGFARPSDSPFDLSYHSFDRRDAAVCKDVDNGLPDNWKCSSSSTCVSLDNTTSALCCPTGQDCSTIRTVECDAKKQDPSKNPGTEVFTTKTDGDLPNCGTTCCPFGYTCSQKSDGSNDGACTIQKEKARFVGDFPGAQGTTSATASSSSSTTSTAKGTATATNSPAKSTPSAGAEDKPNPFPASVFLAGFAPGLFVGALIVIGWMIYTGRIKSGSRSAQSTPRTEKRPMISEPINAQGGRSDFNRVPDSVFNSKETGPNNWKMPTPPEPHGGAVRPITPGTPTPVADKDRTATMESIRIYSPPNFGQHPSATVSPLRTNLPANDRQLTSPFVSPLRADVVPRYDNPAPRDPSPRPTRPASSVYDQSRRTSFAISELEGSGPEYSTSSHQRYDPDPSKRDTSFTALMEHCGIPDSGNHFPVPKIPEQYKGKGNGKR